MGQKLPSIWSLCKFLIIYANWEILSANASGRDIFLRLKALQKKFLVKKLHKKFLEIF